MNIVFQRSLKRLSSPQYAIRQMATTAKTVVIFDEMPNYPFLKTFMYDSQDPIKQKWEIFQSWHDQCQNNPEMTQKQFKVLKQRYELSPLYEDESISEENTFLKQMYEQIKDVDDQTNLRTLSDAQFNVTKRILNENIATKKFIQKVPDFMNEYKDTIDTLKYKKFNYERFEMSVKAWATYKFLSYGHPKAIELHKIMTVNDGHLNAEQFRDVVHYMKKQGGYSFTNKDFKEALKWLSKMQWIIYHPLSNDLYSPDIMHYFDIVYSRYKNMKSVLEDEDTLQRCQYTIANKSGTEEKFEPEVKDLELWLKKLSAKERDPLIVWLKDNLNDGAAYGDLQDAIINRFQLDIGGLLDKYSDILIPLLNNQHLYEFAKEKIDDQREKVLSGKQLNEEYLVELKAMIKSLQQEFNQYKLETL